MKIAVFVTNPRLPPNRSDQWVTVRCEGRAAINSGLGFALLGHEVDLISAYFNNTSMHGVSFLNYYDPQKYYDVVYSWYGGLTPGASNYGKLLRLIEPSNSTERLIEISKLSPRAVLCTLSSKAVPMLAARGVVARYMPCLYPIPCLPGIEEQDFLPFKFDAKKEKLKVWVFINSWRAYHLLCDAQVLVTLRKLRDSYNKNLDVTLLVVEKDSKYNTVPIELGVILSEFGAKIRYSNEMCYLDILNSIMESDICITKGGFAYCGNCSFDIISLGKLMIYITEHSPDSLDLNRQNINDLFPIKDLVLNTYDTVGMLRNKIDKIMGNPEECYNAMRKELITYSFPEWKKIVTEVLSGS